MEKQKFSRTWRRFRTLTIALILLCSYALTALVVYAVSSYNFTMDGNVTFYVSGVNAVITKGTQSSLTVDNWDSMDTLTYSTAGSTSNSGDIDTWSGLGVTLGANTSYLTFTIENTGASGDIYATITTSVDDSTYLTITPTADDGTTSISGTQQTIVQGETLTVKITFTVSDSVQYNLVTGFAIDVSLTGVSTTTEVTSSGTSETVKSAINFCSATDAQGIELTIASASSIDDANFSDSEKSTLEGVLSEPLSEICDTNILSNFGDEYSADSYYLVNASYSYIIDHDTDYTEFTGPYTFIFSGMGDEGDTIIIILTDVEENIAMTYAIVAADGTFSFQIDSDFIGVIYFDYLANVAE